jgi:hypothetical protein
MSIKEPNIKFDLTLAMAGEPIQTRNGTPAAFIAYCPTADASKQVIAQVGTDIVVYYNNGRLSATTEFTWDLFMKPKIKKINWKTMPIDTLLTITTSTRTDTRHFACFRNDEIHYFKCGATSKTTSINDVYAVDASDIQISTKNPWIVWHGDTSPIPEGLEFEVIYRDGTTKLFTQNINSSPDIRHLQDYWIHMYNMVGDIIAYRLTGKVMDGYTL